MVKEINHISVDILAYNSLKESILNNNLKSGQKIKQAKMAESLGISRIPLRQALAKLESEGLVISLPRRGYYVREIKSNELSEILDIRGVIESIAINLIIDNLNQDIEKKLIEFLKSFQQAYEKNNIDEYYVIDRKFHYYLIEASGSNILRKVSNITNIQVLRYIRGFELDIETSLKHHKRLISFITNKNFQEASDLIKKHFNRVKELFKVSTDFIKKDFKNDKEK